MSDITLVIDGIECAAAKGDTILQVARKHDIYIPTLCWMEGLTPIGSCRMCVVEVEGNTKLLTACTTPAENGMTVHTKTDTLKKYRLQILELLFAGRNHFCMFCSQTGDCELQRLAIEHGMDNVRYPFLYEPFHNDASDPNIQMDHNRCILCLRCIRVCAEKVGAHTLDLEKRGWGTNITADLGKMLGESDTCVSCGACAQVCPTGTITLRDFVYRGRRNDCDDQVESICPLCSMGCRIKAYVRTGSVARVEGLSGDSPDGGQLCHKGRWGLPKSTEQERLTVPMIRTGSSFREADWDEALELIASKMSPAAEAGRAGALLSELSTDEELSVVSSFFRDTMKMEKVDGFYGNLLRGFVKGFQPFADQGIRPFTGAHNILESDAIVVIGANPQEEAPVAASYIRVSTIIERAKLINFSTGKNPFEGITDVDLRAAGPREMENLLVSIREAVESGNELQDPFMKETARILRDAKKPVFVIGSSMAEHPVLVTGALNLAVASKAFFSDGLGVVPMLRGGNCLGALNTVIGESDWLSGSELDFLYVLSTGMVDEDKRSLEAMTRARFVVVHTPFMIHPLVNMADVLLPAPAWFERSGHYCTMEGERRRMNMIVLPKGNLKGLSVIMNELAGRLGLELQPASAAPCENVYEAKSPSTAARTVSLKEVR
jgi:formate dehydrogenase major subunit